MKPLKTVFLTNNSCSAIFIANRLNQKGLLDAIIIEETATKIIKKILREIKSIPWNNIPEKILDLFAIWIYSKFSNRYIETHLLKPNNFKIFQPMSTCCKIPQHISISFNKYKLSRKLRAFSLEYFFASVLF